MRVQHGVAAELTKQSSTRAGEWKSGVPGISVLEPVLLGCETAMQ